MHGLWILTLALFAMVLHHSIRNGTIHASRFLAVLFLVAGLEALYGIMQFLAPSLGLGFSEGATGTFASPDHYAAFLGMIWPLQLVWLLRPGGMNTIDRVQGERPEAGGPGSRNASSSRREKQLFFIFLTGLVLLGLILSRSRGGIISLLISTSVLAYFGGKRFRPIIAVLIACWAIILVYGSIIGFEGVVRRFVEIQRDAPARLKIWQYTSRLIWDHWLTGTGAGTYSPVIFLYQIFDTDLIQVGHAHSDYLEVASEWGLPFGLLIFILVWGYWLLTAVRLAEGSNPGTKKRGDTEIRSLGKGRHIPERRPPETAGKLIRIGALAGSAAFLCHMFVEFNWQIPVNQLYFVILLVLMTDLSNSTESSQ
jgi:O-antigen ligase